MLPARREAMRGIKTLANTSSANSTLLMCEPSVQIAAVMYDEIEGGNGGPH
jgi:hypothetical protein